MAHNLKQAWDWCRLMEPEEKLQFFGYLVKHDGQSVAQSPPLLSRADLIKARWMWLAMLVRLLRQQNHHVRLNQLSMQQYYQ